ncbi:hypothetical protein ACER0C_002535 [Sarotherodon galilaeus]
MGNIKVGLTPANQSEGMEIEEELTSLLPTLDREKIICIVEHLTDVIGVQQKNGNRPENLNDTITLEPCPAASPETSSHPRPPLLLHVHHYVQPLLQLLGLTLTDSLGKISTPTVACNHKRGQSSSRGQEKYEGPGAVERPDVDGFMCLTYISQRQLINSCPSLSVAEIQEQWPFLFTWKGLLNHFYKLTGIDISERLGQALITKGRRIINYFSSQKLKWNLGIRTLIQQIESEGVLTNNKVGTAAILPMMKYYKEDEDSLFVLADETSTRMSLEAESNLPITPRLIMLGQSSMTATCWRVSAEGRVIVELDKENTFADAMSVFFGSFYILNLEYQESACATLELIQRYV